VASPFLTLPADAHIASNDLAFALLDPHPLAPGHTLVVPRRPVAAWAEATPAEQSAIFALVDLVKHRLDAQSPAPAGYHVAFSMDGATPPHAAHLHVHVVPRYAVHSPRAVAAPIAAPAVTAAPEGPPTADPGFVEKLLTLLDQSQFTATYKFAVLLGLLDLCMEHATERGFAPGSVTTRQLADKVVALYWPQTAPWSTGAASATLLSQSAGSPRGARILSQIVGFRTSHAPEPSATLLRAIAAAPVAYEALVREVEWTLVTMPLPRLQLLPGHEEDRFLYEIAWSLGAPVSPSAFRAGRFDNVIRFVGGASEQLIALATVIRPLVQRRWAAKVARLNHTVVVDARLEDFLFGAPRIPLAAVRDPLVELHNGRCFYCDDKLAARVDVDHFIAWSRHPENAIENLVPAHPTCNSSKSDHLAGAVHLRHWAERLRAHGADLGSIAQRATWDHDPGRVLAVARVLYLRLPDTVRLWHSRDAFEVARRPALRDALTG